MTIFYVFIPLLLRTNKTHVIERLNELNFRKPKAYSFLVLKPKLPNQYEISLAITNHWSLRKNDLLRNQNIQTRNEI
jgi:hypothetical protein